MSDSEPDAEMSTAYMPLEEYASPRQSNAVLTFTDYTRKERKLATPTAPIDAPEEEASQTFVLSEGAREQVAREALIDNVSQEEVLRNALGTHLWLKGILRQGARVTIKHSDGRREILRYKP